VRPSVELGLGIIGLGKVWGHVSGEVPSELEAVGLLEFAWLTGIRYFDAAPSYGVAEERLGLFLRALDPVERRGLTIATKFGEHWDAARNEPFVDHSYDALCRSLDRSLRHLGRIDILQLHKTTPDALRSRDLARAWDYAASLGITRLGASVSDLESAGMVIDEPRYSAIQLPLNRSNTTFSASVERASERGMWIATNRPFAMGAMLYGEQPVSREEAFRFVLDHAFTGVVLTGTRSREHLRENWLAFESVTNSC
jgi:aryl-alcohol dehydrogenase-like predicted oxidoreductase